MKRLTAYLLRALLLAMVFITFAVTAAVWLTQSLRYVDVVVENGAPLHLFVWLALLTLPTFLSIILPVALFVAVLFTYHRFIQDSELIAMRACGMGPHALAGPALMMAGGVMAICFAISLWLQPLANRELLRMQYFVQSQFSAALLKEGTFNDLGNKMTVYVARREQNAELSGLLIHDARNDQKPITIRAARGQLVQGVAGPQVIVYDGVQQEYDKTRHRVTELTFDSYAVSLDSLVPNATERKAHPREIGTLDLVAQMTTEPDPAFRQRLVSEFHQRLSGPLLAVGYTLIAACSLLFGDFSRRGNAWRVITAVALAALLQALALGMGQAATRTMMAVPALYFSVMLPIILGIEMLWRSERRRWA